jgi:signal recognition particle subunit SRP72
LVRNKKKKVRKIKWPKNFNFGNPGPRPDPERWIPMSFRKKGTKKKGKQQTKTQGVYISQTSNVELFQAQNSTANIEVAKSKKSKK